MLPRKSLSSACPSEDPIENAVRESRLFVTANDCPGETLWASQAHGTGRRENFPGRIRVHPRKPGERARERRAIAGTQPELPWRRKRIAAAAKRGKACKNQACSKLSLPSGVFRYADSLSESALLSPLLKR